MPLVCAFNTYKQLCYQLTAGFDLSTVSLTRSGSAVFNVPFAINIAFTRAAASAAAAIPHPPATDVAVWLSPADERSCSATSSGRMSHLLSDGALSHLLSSGNLSHLLLRERLSRFAGNGSSLPHDSGFFSVSGPLSHLLDRFLHRKHSCEHASIIYIKPLFYTACCSKKCFLEVETVRHQCRSVRETLRHWYRTVQTLRHQSDGTKMSWVRIVLGPKCLDKINYLLI